MMPSQLSYCPASQYNRPHSRIHLGQTDITVPFQEVLAQ